MIKIYTDGSCLGNPGKGGWAAIILNEGKKTELKGRVQFFCDVQAYMLIGRFHIQYKQSNLILYANLYIIMHNRHAFFAILKCPLFPFFNNKFPKNCNPF